MTRRHVSRRQVLGAAAGAVAFPYIVPSSVFGAAAPSGKITMGCIGVGSQGSGNMNGFLDKKDDARILAVCDVDKGHRDAAKRRVDEKYGNSDCATYHDFRELIARDDIDALSLALPDHWHSIPVIMAARAGKDMYGEKPLARTIHEGKMMVEAVHRYDRIWQTGSWQRSQENFHHACELVRNGRIGKVTRVEVGLPSGGATGNPPVSPVPEGLDWDFWLGPAPWRPFTKYGGNAPHWDWRWIMDYSGGQLTDWAGHHIDIAHWGLGLEDTGPVEIEGEGVFPKDGIYDVPTEYKFTCKYANGVEMIVASDRLVPKGMGAVWYGDKGWIHVDRGRQATNPPELWNEKIGPGEMRLYESRDHQQNFLDCVKTRKKTITPIEVAYRSISVGHLGEIAMLLGRKIHWDPDKQVFVNDDAANRMLSRPMRAPWHL
ncbi:MAG: Gfo/Idh/MocA family oxidoreductase [Sedimentisphaerales bacterium]|nr:Gfo/Idh/MocA family oxidoreductase [Sedimentisphaerales bacterium]HNY77060.1 Gfo/Idh/MocA family oxidoreductase [Sedimentisphaerales bacterium]HOC62525.1 Gfo/Idh/MocA family oxidoreductase [Sedimentisphaerales bacterium]HOH63043.1 Gfo/Idh/MocA family oxidoreductase [Sedimentisphaerales bacterium]HPY49616.1 Gfo/Idh/MocA family oxidoreductase [Sedimentisphaerales bacterium]